MATDFDTYQLMEVGVRRLADFANIPPVFENGDWKRYQEWLAEGRTPRPKQPADTFVWDGAGQVWVEDPLLAQQKSNRGLEGELDGNDRDAIRSIRSIVNTLARLSPAFQPPSNTDQAFLVNNEQLAQTTRKGWLPPAAPTLPQAKGLKIEQLRVQGLAYIGIGFLGQSFRWRASVDQVTYMSYCGYLLPGQVMSPDGRIHVWDYNGVERILASSGAAKLAGAMQGWLYLAQQEFWVQVAKVNACTTVAQVDAIVWTTRYTTAAPWDSDTPFPQVQDLPEQPPLEQEILDQIVWT